MQDQDIINEDERHEAATEEPTTLGCPSLGPKVLPSGFDGVEPGKPVHGLHGLHGLKPGDNPCESVKSVDEIMGQKKRSDLEKLNEVLLERIGEIVNKCSDLLVVCDPDRVDYDAAETNIKLLGAFTDLRQMCDFYKPSDKPADPTAKEMKSGKGRLFKSKHISSCHGTHVYDYICINDAHIRASLHFDNGGLENHATLWVGEGERFFCCTTFNTSSAVKCDYLVRGMIVGLAKRIVYHHKALINRKAKWAAAKKGGAK